MGNKLFSAESNNNNTWKEVTPVPEYEPKDASPEPEVNSDSCIIDIKPPFEQDLRISTSPLFSSPARPSILSPIGRPRTRLSDQYLCPPYIMTYYSSDDDNSQNNEELSPVRLCMQPRHKKEMQRRRRSQIYHSDMTENEYEPCTLLFGIYDDPNDFGWGWNH